MKTLYISDLDGTLLPMNQEKFVTFYLPLLAEKMKKYGQMH